MAATLTAAQEKQSKILEVAEKLFLERGYDAVSLDDILEQVGGSKTTLYSYYGGKEGLFAATVRKSCGDRLKPLMELRVQHLDARAGLEMIGRKFLLLVTDKPGQAMHRIMIGEASRFPRLAQEFYAAGPECAIRFISQQLAHWQKQGLVRKGNSESMAVQFIGIVLGNFTIKHLLGLASGLSPKEIKEWVASSVAIFMDGVVQR